MTWQGIPFPLAIDKIVTTSNLAIEKIPKVFIDAGDNSWSITAAMIATILGSLIAGSIPAFIAWKTIQKNQEATEADRITRQISFDKDREAQMMIAAKNFNAQVLSANRQAWINELREVVSEYVSSMDDYVSSYYEISDVRKRFDAFKAYYDSLKSPTSEAIDAMNQRTAESSTARKNKDQQAKELNKLMVKASLMLNPKEKLSEEIIQLMKELYVFPHKIVQSDDIDDSQIYADLYKKTFKLLELVQECLKSEWTRVKAGA